VPFLERHRIFKSADTQYFHNDGPLCIGKPQ
jgi:hypothetical protein